RLLGTKIKRLDAPEKATGRAKYSYDINRPGMLHAMILRSPYAHAKIKSIDMTAARKVPGLKALALIGISRDGTAGEVDAKAGKLVFNLDPGKKKEKVEPRTIQVTDAVTIIKDNKVVKLADLKMGDPITIEVEQDIVGKELFYAGDEIAAVAADTEEHAHDALRAIKVDYEVLDHIVSEEEVLKNLDKKTTPGGQKGNLQPGTAALKGKPGEDKEEGGL